MKKVYALLLPLLLAMSAGAQVTTPQFLLESNADSCTSHRFRYNTYVPSITLGKIEHSYGDGSKDTAQLVFDFNTGSTMATFTRSYAMPGTYTSKAVLLYNGARVDSVTQQYFSGNCKAFTGNIYKDDNNNCTLDHDDNRILSSLRVKVDSAGVPIDTITAFGAWAFMRPWNVGAGQYTFTVLNLAGDYTSSCQTANSRSVMYGGYGSPLPAPVNFGYTCGTGSGTDAIAGGGGNMRAAAVAPSVVSGRVTNMGCLPSSGTLSVKVSPKYVLTGTVTPPPASVVGNTVTWNFTGLAHGATQIGYVYATPVTPQTVGDTAGNVFTVTTSSPDANPVNNYFIHYDTIRNSFDPNDKSVLPAGNINAGTTLTYHINFENLGTDTAFNIHVLDTLSANLDAASFELLGASHAVRVMELGNAPRVLKFDFPNIRLADKTAPAYNKGFVRFSIKAKTGLAFGTDIPNRAGIYFDANPAIMTNTATNKIGTPQSVQVLVAGRTASIHPNPATDRLTITNADGMLTDAVLMNTTGQTLRRWTLSAGDNHVSIDDLPVGFYFVQLHSAAGVQVEKLEKR